MKYRIYIAHSRDERLRYKEELYTPLKSFYENHEVVVPHGEGPYIDSEVFLPTCSLMIAEVSYPSTGLGMELIWARSANVPVLCIHKSECQVSSSVTNKFSDFISYKNLSEMVQKIDFWIVSHRNRIKPLNSDDCLCENSGSSHEVFSSVIGDYPCSFFERLTNEYIFDHKNDNAGHRHEFDKRFGLIIRK